MSKGDTKTLICIFSDFLVLKYFEIEWFNHDFTSETYIGETNSPKAKTLPATNKKD